MGWFLIMMDQPALIDTLPVLGQELPVRPRLYRGMVLLAADKAFHKSRLFVNKFRGVLFLGHNPLSGEETDIGVDWGLVQERRDNTTNNGITCDTVRHS
jgi:hypothetical protein